MASLSLGLPEIWTMAHMIGSLVGHIMDLYWDRIGSVWAQGPAATIPGSCQESCSGFCKGGSRTVGKGRGRCP